MDIVDLSENGSVRLKPSETSGNCIFSREYISKNEPIIQIRQVFENLETLENPFIVRLKLSSVRDLIQYLKSIENRDDSNAAPPNELLPEKAVIQHGRTKENVIETRGKHPNHRTRKRLSIGANDVPMNTSKAKCIMCTDHITIGEKAVKFETSPRLPLFIHQSCAGALAETLSNVFNHSSYYSDKIL